MKFVIEIISLVIYGLLGALNIRDMITAFIDRSYFTGGLSLMATVIIITCLVKTINAF